MEQADRIRQMEQRLERASVAVMEMAAALDKYIEVQEDIAILEAYYGSNEWKHDLADDEAGRLPADLKRGVLSEDGVWNMLTDNREVCSTVHELLARTKE